MRTGDAALVGGGAGGVVGRIQRRTAKSDGVGLAAAAIVRQRGELRITGDIARERAAQRAACAVLHEVVAERVNRAGAVAAVARHDAVTQAHRAALLAESTAAVAKDGDVVERGAAGVVQATTVHSAVAAEGGIGQIVDAGAAAGDGPAIAAAGVVVQRAAVDGDGAAIVVDGAAPTASAVAAEGAAVHGEAAKTHFHRAAKVYGRIICNFAAILHHAALEHVKSAAAKNGGHGAIGRDAAAVDGEQGAALAHVNRAAVIRFIVGEGAAVDGGSAVVEHDARAAKGGVAADEAAVDGGRAIGDENAAAGEAVGAGSRTAVVENLAVVHEQGGAGLVEGDAAAAAGCVLADQAVAQRDGAVVAVNAAAVLPGAVAADFAAVLDGE